jgi:peptidoglycan/LPS O-acetylase OafA/YrhL
MPKLVHAVIFGVFGTGTYYVFGFFVLSGYCIHLSVERSIQGRQFPVGRYFAARLTRILPLYYLGLLVALAVEWAIVDARPWEWPNGRDAGTLISQVFMVQYLTETFGAYASSWSLTNEVFYYILYGVLAYLMAGRKARPAWTGLGICVAVAVLMQVLYVTVGHNQVVYRTGGLFGLGTLWFEGALVAIYGKEWVKIAWVRQSARLWPAVLAIVIAWKTALLPLHGFYLMSGVAFSLMLLHLIATSPAEVPEGVSRRRTLVVTTLGLASYPVYLFHGPILMLVGSLLMRWGVITDWRVTSLVLLSVGLSLGPPLGWLVERPVMAWRAATLRRWKGTVSRGVPGRPASALRPAPIGAGARYF